MDATSATILHAQQFPDDDPFKTTNELKVAIGTYLLERMEKKKDSLLEEHTEDWESDVTSFVEAFRVQLEQRLEQIKDKAKGLSDGLTTMQDKQSASETLLRNVYTIRRALEDLTYDLAVS